MKNQNYLFWGLKVLALFFALITTVSAVSQIVSAPGGGLWSSGTTWIGGVVPTAGSDVHIASIVYVNGSFSCNNITINSGGTLNNMSNNNYTLTVNGNFTNAGTVADNIYNLYINVNGNVTNHGSFTNNSLTLSGIANQEVAATQPFAIANFAKTATSGKAVVTTDLNFIGTTILLNNDTLEFTTGNAVSLDGGSLNSGILYKSSFPALNLTTVNGAHLQAITIDAPQTELYGSILIFGASSNFKNNVINFGTLQNRSNNNYTLIVSGNFTNNGTVQNNVYNLYLNISGNLTNNGTWTNYSTVLNGSVNQGLAMTQPFSGNFLTRVASTGRVRATTAINFVGTEINFNSDTLEFTTGNIFNMSGGYLSSCVLYKSALPALQITSGNNAYVHIVKIDAPETEIFGDLRIYFNSNVFKTNVTNSGIVQNYQSNSYTLNVIGSFTNNGTVKNNVYNLTLNITGNLSNNGTWTNLTTTLNGTANQVLAMTQPFGGANFLRSASSGRIQATTGISFVGTEINFNSDTLEFTTGNTFSMTGGYLSSCVLYKSSLPALQITSGNNAYVYLVTIDAPETEIFGDLRIYGSSNVFKTNVTNSGVAQNYQSNSYTLNVIGSFTNSGTVKNNIYNFSLNISGNVTNNGNWINYQTSLTGTNTHSIAFSNRFEGNFFTNTNAAGSMIATTDLIFDGTTIDLNNCSLSLPNGGTLSVQDGSLTDAVISGTNIQYHSLSAYCVGVVFNSDVTLQGIFQAGTGVSFNGSIINNGVMRNRSNNHYGIQVEGGIENNGSITNNVYNLNITVLGDIHNNGTWSNNLTILDGSTDQNIYLINSNSIQGQIRLDANFSGSSFTWWGPLGSLIGNPDFSGANSQLLNFLDPITIAATGEYYCVNNLAIQSRSIFINSTTLPDFSLDITVLLEGPFNGVNLNTQLNSNNFLPLVQPYFEYPWVYPGGESVVSIPSGDIADWVLIELRDATAPNSATSTTKVAEYAGFLLDNGKVVALDGVSNIVFHDVIVNDLFVVVRHRNHLDVMSSTALVESGGTYSYNFTTGTNQAYGTDAQNEIATGVWGMKTGDGNGDGTINLSDKAAWSRDAAKSGYYAADYLLKGFVNNQDKNDIWLNKLGEQSQIP